MSSRNTNDGILDYMNSLSCPICGHQFQCKGRKTTAQEGLILRHITECSSNEKTKRPRRNKYDDNDNVNDNDTQCTRKRHKTVRRRRRSTTIVDDGDDYDDTPVDRKRHKTVRRRRRRPTIVDYADVEEEDDDDDDTHVDRMNDDHKNDDHCNVEEETIMTPTLTTITTPPQKKSLTLTTITTPPTKYSHSSSKRSSRKLHLKDTQSSPMDSSNDGHSIARLKQSGGRHKDSLDVFVIETNKLEGTSNELSELPSKIVTSETQVVEMKVGDTNFYDLTSLPETPPKDTEQKHKGNISKTSQKKQIIISSKNQTVENKEHDELLASPTETLVRNTAKKEQEKDNKQSHVSIKAEAPKENKNIELNRNLHKRKSKLDNLTGSTTTCPICMKTYDRMKTSLSEINHHVLSCSNAQIDVSTITSKEHSPTSSHASKKSKARRKASSHANHNKRNGHRPVTAQDHSEMILKKYETLQQMKPKKSLSTDEETTQRAQSLKCLRHGPCETALKLILLRHLDSEYFKKRILERPDCLAKFT